VRGSEPRSARRAATAAKAMRFKQCAAAYFASCKVGWTTCRAANHRAARFHDELARAGKHRGSRARIRHPFTAARTSEVLGAPWTEMEGRCFNRASVYRRSDASSLLGRLGPEWPRLGHRRCSRRWLAHNTPPPRLHQPAPLLWLLSARLATTVTRRPDWGSKHSRSGMGWICSR
jgi:hypothetical protein